MFAEIIALKARSLLTYTFYLPEFLENVLLVPYSPFIIPLVSRWDLSLKKQILI